MPLSLDPDRERPQKDLGGIWGLYDKPVWRDWLAWWTAFWLAVGVLSIVFPTDATARTSTMPVWLNAVISGAVIGSILGLLPAYARVLVRRQLIKAQRRRTEGVTQASEPELNEIGIGQTPLRRRTHVEPLSSTPEAASPLKPATEQSKQAGLGGTRHPHGGRPTTPTPLSNIRSDDLQHDATLSRAAGTFPYPIARACRRLQLATEPKDIYENTLRTGETLATVLGITATAWAMDRQITEPAIDRLLGSFKGGGVSQGSWLEVGNSLERQLQESGDLPGLSEVLRRRRGQPGAVTDLKAITSERNNWAHGASPRSQSEAQERLKDMLPPLIRAIATADGLSQHDWLLVSDAQLDRRTRKFRLSASRAMGAHPDWDRQDLISETAIVQDSFYLASNRGLIDLTPFVVQRTCPKCNQAEVAYADRLDRKKGVSLKSFDTGHPFFDVGLSHDFDVIFSSSPSSPDSVS